jgi:hypothetical protein
MRTLFRLAGSRLLPALLTALGVVLITGGLLSYADPNTIGAPASPSAGLPTDVAIVDPSDDATDPPEPTDSAEDPASPGVSPSASLDAGSPPASVVPDPTPTPTAKPTPEPTRHPGRQVATRVVVPALNIDMPVVKGNDGYPYCNVAMYLHTANTAARDAFGQPGEGRATYLYAHARDGMFGPIYQIAMVRQNPKRFLGMIVQVYSSDNKLYLYEITEYRLHAVGPTALEDAINATSEQVWLQTSEGPKGTPGKTQIIGHFVSVSPASHAEANPRPRPVACG